MSVNQVTGHGGDQVLAALAPFGVKELFTLSGDISSRFMTRR